MNNLQITLTETTLTKNPNTKTSYIKGETTTKQITKDQFKKITSEDTCKWFRRLGGSESVTRSYTCYGYVCVKLISTSPDRETKKVREFDFKYTG